MSMPRRRLVTTGLPERSGGMRQGPGRIRMPAGLPRQAGQPGLPDLLRGLDMLGEVIAEGDTVARSVALCLLALLIERFPTVDLQEHAEDMLASFLAEYPSGPALRATIHRLRATSRLN